MQGNELILVQRPELGVVVGVRISEAGDNSSSAKELPSLIESLAALN